jgi:hypothetical protein
VGKENIERLLNNFKEQQKTILNAI